MPDQSMDCAVLFADISGSTQLYEKLGDQVAERVINGALDRLTGVATVYMGRRIKLVGDEVMCRFPDANSAIRAACAMQEFLQMEPVDEAPELAIHIGVDYGSVIVREGDLFGDVVNNAAYMTDLARTRQIVATASVAENLGDALDQRARAVDRVKIKGKRDPVDVYEVVWEQTEDVTRLATDTLKETDGNRELLLRYRNKGLNLDPESEPIVMGRSRGADLPVNAKLGSRQHCRIEYNNGKFVLTDQSTNGTYVRTQDGQEVMLRREEMPLWGQGIISLGASVEKEASELVYFLCT